MSEELKARARRFYDDVMTKGDLKVLDEIVDPSFVDHEQFPGLASGPEGVKQFVATMRGAFPDLQVSVDDMLTDGDKVIVRGTMKGTHKGVFMGIAATGKRIDVNIMDIVRFAKGKAVEHWGLTDQMAMLQQLGVIPEQP